jgi:hypothetical protein
MPPRSLTGQFLVLSQHCAFELKKKCAYFSLRRYGFSSAHDVFFFQKFPGISRLTMAEEKKRGPG